MKKAKLLLNLTLALAVSTAAVACADQGAVDDRTYRGAGQYKGRNLVNNYTIDTNDLNDRNRTGVMGRDNYRTARGLFNTPGAGGGYGAPGGGLLNGGMGYRMDRTNGNDMFDGAVNPATNEAQRAQAIERRILAIPGVQDCQVAVNGNDVVVGVDPANGQQDQVMNQVRQQLQNMAPNQDCYVTTDQNLINRLGDTNGLLQRGAKNATAQFKQLVNDIGGKINR